MSRLSLLASSAIAASAVFIAAPACAQDARDFNIPAGPLDAALNQFAAQADQQIFFSGDMVSGRRFSGLTGRYAPSAALDRLLAGTGLTWAQTRPGVIFLRRGGSSASLSEPTTQLEEVVVTGTLLKSSGDLASPVVMLDRAELDRSGRGTVAEVLVDLPQNYAGAATPVVQASAADRSGSNSVYATGVNLRGLGPSSTLVLVNGRRLAGTGFRGEFADVSALPSAAVERVDVLLDGASALYGADAVAGVVNVIMRRSFDGQETRFRAAAAEGGAEDVTVSHLAGRSWSSGSAYLSYEYQTTNPLNSQDRPYTRDGDLRPFGGTDHRNLYAAPGNIVAFNAATAAYVSQFALRPNASGVVQTAADFAAGQTNQQLLSQGADLVPGISRHGVYGRVRQSLGDRLELTGDLRFSRRDYEMAGAASAGIFTVNRANPYFVSPTGAASHTIAYSFLRDIGPTRLDGSSESFGVTLGARYALTDAWSLEGYLALAGEHGNVGVFNRVNSRYLNEALGALADDPATPFRAATDGYFNLFGAGVANSRAVLDFVGSGYSLAEDESRARSANLLLTGPLVMLPGGEVEVAVGLQYRQETFDTQTSVLGATVAPVDTIAPRRKRSIAAVFAEARVPIVGEQNAQPWLRALDVSVAGRLEEYDDFGTTFNPKVGLVWSPAEDWSVRSSWGTSFRAASLPLIYDTASVSGTFLNRADGTRALVLLLNGGNPDLKPETAETFTAGLDYRRPGGLSLTAGYFDTRFEDRIARPVSENSAGALTDPALAPFVRTVAPATNPADLSLIESYASTPGFPTLYPTNTYGAIVDMRWVNTGAVRVRGVDLSARYPMALGSGALILDASASYMLDYDTQPTPTAAVRQVVGLIGYPVRLRARSGATWTSGGFSLGGHWAYVDGYEDRLGAPIDSWNTVDAQVSWSPTSQPLAGLRVTLSVQNLFDAEPPFYDAPSGYGFDPGQGSLLGRVVALQVARRW